VTLCYHTLFEETKEEHETLPNNRRQNSDAREGYVSICRKNVIRKYRKRGRKMKKAGHVSRGETRGAYRAPVRISAGKRSLGRPRHKWGGYY
jgi:hypothetical protein